MFTMEELSTVGMVGCCLVPLVFFGGWYFVLLLDSLMAATLNWPDPRQDSEEALKGKLKEKYGEDE